ncbi:MAG: tetratricopeptide repeat protein [Alphaproteobacteria bacterium]|nr:tetratricopeptide repeat protein [Alphaproteobacteria bacterium]
MKTPPPAPDISLPAVPPAHAPGHEPPPPKAVPVMPVRVAEPVVSETPEGEDEEAAFPAHTNKVVSLSFSWSQPVAAAVFMRAGHLWVVFDRAQELDIKLLRRLGGDAIRSIEQIPQKSATVVRVLPQPGFNPSVRREGLLWVVDLMHQPLRPKAPIPIKAEPASSAGPRLILQVPDPGPMIPVVDTTVGDTMAVIPVMPQGSGVSPARLYPDFELPVTIQGVVMLRRAENVGARPSRNGIEIIGSGAGLHLSRDAERLEGKPGAKEEKSLSQIFDIKNWVHDGDQDFTKQRRAMEAAAAAHPKAENRQGARMELARFHFANGNPSDALGILQVIAGDDPSALNAAPFRALRGAANVMMYRFEEAVEDLGHPSLASNDEAGFWRAAAEAALGAPGAQAEALREKAAALKDYPHRIKTRLALIGAEAAIAASDEMTARSFLEAATSERNTPAEQAAITYWTGRLNELTGSFDLAVSNWEEVEAGLDRLNRARSAMARLELQLRLKRITPADAVEGMERLRFAWRGDAFEYNLLKRLGELQIASGDYGGGLRTFKQIVISYGDNPETPKIADMMRETYDKLYLTKAVEDLPPVTAIALFDEFHDLIPTGEKGDEMIRRLADRLVAVDLLDRAGSLLDNQVKFRLNGIEKAKVGTRLALVHLLNRQPQKAVDSLTESEMPGMSAELSLQRRHLTARALSDLGRTDEATELLTGDKSEDGRLLAAEINWKNKKWAEAAEILEGLVDKPKRGGKMDPKQARWVLSAATALTLAKDERGVARLRRQYLDGLADADVFDAFNLITTGAEKGVLDYRQVAGKLKLAEGFKAFMGNYGERLKKGQLSGIN